MGLMLYSPVLEHLKKGAKCSFYKEKEKTLNE